MYILPASDKQKKENNCCPLYKYITAPQLLELPR